jgi:hypothetical protein
MIMQVKRMQRIAFSLVSLALAGCASLPTGPSVLVLPTPGKPFEVFQTEDRICRQWANQQLGASPQEIKSQNTATGAAVGTAVGVGVGAAIGAAAGDAAAGAAIGGGSGLLMGTAAGASSGDYYGDLAQRQYDHAYLQCMYIKGNQIPGVVRQSRPARKTAPPPPPDYPAPQPAPQ